jgi:hypothetical protein
MTQPTRRCGEFIRAWPGRPCGAAAKEMINGHWLCGRHAGLAKRIQREQLTREWSTEREDLDYLQRLAMRKWLITDLQEDLKPLVQRLLSKLTMRELVLVREVKEVWQWRVASHGMQGITDRII